MIPYTLNGVTFQADEKEDGAFHVFNPSRPESQDPSPFSMAKEMGIFMDMTEDMKSFVDVGALFGIFSIMFTSRPGTVAYAIEPSPYAYPFLESHVKANPAHQIRPINAFIGEVNGLDVPCGVVWKHVIAGEKTSEMVTRTTVMLDELLPTEPVDCMKIDVEGYECQVLRGGRKLIERCRPLIFLECHLASLHTVGESPESLFSLLTEFGYDILDFKGGQLTKFEGSFNRVVCDAN